MTLRVAFSVSESVSLMAVVVVAPESRVVVVEKGKAEGMAGAVIGRELYVINIMPLPHMRAPSANSNVRSIPAYPGAHDRGAPTLATSPPTPQPLSTMTTFALNDQSMVNTLNELVYMQA